MPALAAYAAQRFVVHADLMPGAGVLDALGLLDIVHTALSVAFSGLKNRNRIHSANIPSWTKNTYNPSTRTTSDGLTGKLK